MLIKSHFTNWKVQRNASEKVQRNAYICDRIPYHLLCGENVVAAIHYKNCIIPIISSHMAVGRNQTHVYHGSIRRLRVLLRWASITWECFSGEHQSPENPSQVSVHHLRILLRWASITWESFLVRMRFGVFIYGLSALVLVLWGGDDAVWTPHEASRRRSLGEQVQSLQNVAHRLVTLRRMTAAMQVTLARAIVLRALASIAVRCVLVIIVMLIKRQKRLQ